MNAHIQKSKKRYLWEFVYTILPLLVILGVLASIFFRHVSFMQLKSLSFIHPEPFIELYFTNHLTVRQHAIAGAQQSFQFTLVSHEGKPETLPYEVFYLANGKKIVIDAQSVVLKNNEMKTIQENFIFPTPLDKAHVVVSLSSTQEKIAYWVTVTQSVEE